jgi:hypothetical protein
MFLMISKYAMNMSDILNSFFLIQYLYLSFRIQIKVYPKRRTPITVAAQCKAWTVFARSNAGIVGSNPTQGMDASLR